MVDKQLRLQQYYFCVLHSPTGRKKVICAVDILYFSITGKPARIRLMRQHGTRLFCRKAYFILGRENNFPTFNKSLILN
jgi:hypothetical protein